MAANFWKGSQCARWTLDEAPIERAKEREGSYLSRAQQNALCFFFVDVIKSLGQALKLRQQVVATAAMFFKRFYFKNPWTSVEPFLMAQTCVYLATKVEECGPIQARSVTATSKRVAAQFYRNVLTEAFTTEEIVVCEFFLVQAMDCCLVVFHPYRSLVEFADNARIVDNVLPLAWNIVNDSYKSDLCFLYPPYLIALGALQIASTVLKQGSVFGAWLSELLNVSTSEVMEVVQYLLDLYGMLTESKPETMIREALDTVHRESSRRDALISMDTPSDAAGTAASTRTHTPVPGGDATTAATAAGDAAAAAAK